MTPDRFKPLLDREFLKGELHYEYVDYCAGTQDAELHERLAKWAKRELKRETQAEGSFVQRFFVETWGYRDDGSGAHHFQLYPKFPIIGAGQTGNVGEADRPSELRRRASPEFRRSYASSRELGARSTSRKIARGMLDLRSTRRAIISGMRAGACSATSQSNLASPS